MSWRQRAGLAIAVMLSPAPVWSAYSGNEAVMVGVIGGCLVAAAGASWWLRGRS